MRRVAWIAAAIMLALPACNQTPGEEQSRALDHTTEIPAVTAGPSESILLVSPDGQDDSVPDGDPTPNRSAEARRHTRLWPTEETLARAKAELQNPDSRMQALGKLIRFAGLKLHPMGSIGVTIADRELDSLCARAANAALSCRDIVTISQALEHPSPILRSWGRPTSARSTTERSETPSGSLCYRSSCVWHCPPTMPASATRQ